MKTRAFVMMASFFTAMAFPAAGALSPPPASDSEPNVKIAIKWWPELTNLVTPLGWRDHLHRFNVLYDGTILARPPGKPPRLEGETDPTAQGVQLSFVPLVQGMPPAPPREEDYPLSLPGGLRVGDQGWTDDAAPVLWTRRTYRDEPLAGLQVRQSIFAHLAGGEESASGVEPIFAWVRIELTALPAKPTPTITVAVVLNAPHIDFDMLESKNVMVQPSKSAYPRALRMEKPDANRPDANRALIVEPDNAVRLAALTPRGVGDVAFVPAPQGSRDAVLHVTLPAKVGAAFELIVPMIRLDRALFEKELALGRDRALAEANAFWSPRPASAAVIHTPESLVNAALYNSVRLARMISLTIPSTREKTLLSGSMVYSMLWITPTSMTSHMLLDPLGWHAEVEKYLDIHLANQGKVKPPGDDFLPHAGYFGVPAPIDAGYQWLTDHGAALYTASRHAQLTGDAAFVAKWQDAIVRACEFVRDARRLPRKPPQVQGVMPSASASDKKDPIQSFWSDGWNYKGLSTAAALLRQLNHPRADEFERESADYRAAIVKAFRAKAARMPKWKDRAGNDRPIVPMSLNADDSNGYGIDHPFYLDTGPMFGVYAGVLPVDDELMKTSVAFFREGPHVPPGETPFVWDKPAYLWHEMSSAEPCYSWNVFHAHQLGERERYLQAMYSLFTGALSRQTHVSCETRGGITENVFSNTLAVYLARLAVVDDEIEPGSLHLLRLAPLAWVSATDETRFENMPTAFGPVTLKWKLEDGKKTLRVDFEPKFRNAPKAVTLHVTPVPGLANVVVNGKSHPVAGGMTIGL